MTPVGLGLPYHKRSRLNTNCFVRFVRAFPSVHFAFVRVSIGSFDVFAWNRTNVAPNVLAGLSAVLFQTFHLWLSF